LIRVYPLVLYYLLFQMDQAVLWLPEGPRLRDHLVDPMVHFHPAVLSLQLDREVPNFQALQQIQTLQIVLMVRLVPADQDLLFHQQLLLRLALLMALEVLMVPRVH